MNLEGRLTLRKHHPENERINRRYFTYIEEAHRFPKASVDQVAAAIVQLGKSTAWRDFRKFDIEQARRFKRSLHEQINPETGRVLAKATIHSRLIDARGVRTKARKSFVSSFFPIGGADAAVIRRIFKTAVANRSPFDNGYYEVS